MANDANEQDLGIPTKVHARSPEEMRPLIEQLLRAEFPDRESLHLSDLDVPTGAGVANETLLMTAEWEGGSEGFVLRLDSDDKLFPEPAFADHFRLYDAMHHGQNIPAPRVFGLCMDKALMGSAFFFMERIAGQVPSDQPPFHSSGWVFEKSADEQRTMWENAVTGLANVHRTPVEDVVFLNRSDAGATGFEQELDYNLRFMHDALNGDRHRVIDIAARWLEKNLPSSVGTGFSWGDSRPQNIIFAKDHSVAALLDWDMASLAGAEADLAWWTLLDFSMTRSRDVPRLPGWGSPAETIKRWEELSQRKALDMHYHFVFAAFRGAVIVMKLAKMLDKKGHLPEASRDWIDNNMGVQYLAALLEIKPMAEDNLAWPGLD